MIIKWSSMKCLTTSLVKHTGLIHQPRRRKILRTDNLLELARLFSNLVKKLQVPISRNTSGHIRIIQQARATKRSCFVNLRKQVLSRSRMHKSHSNFRIRSTKCKRLFWDNSNKRSPLMICTHVYFIRMMKT